MTPVLVRRRAVCDLDVPAAARPVPHLGAPAALKPVAPLLAPATSLHCFATEEPVVALTYDDGPDPEQTPGVLDALAEYGVRATFFVLVERAREHPDLVRRIVEEGHDLGLHGEDHSRLTALPPRQAVRRVLAARRELAGLAGRDVRLYRPAYGAQSLGMVLGVRLAGLDVVLWSAWARDWEAGTPEETAARAAAGVHPGAVLLLHDGAGDGVDGATEVAAVPDGVQPGRSRTDPSVAVSSRAVPAQAVPPGGGPPQHRARTTALLLDRLVAAGYSTGTVTGLAARHRAVRSVWFERRTAPAA